jgi:hypothetical protein
VLDWGTHSDTVPDARHALHCSCAARRIKTLSLSQPTISNWMLQ